MWQQGKFIAKSFARNVVENTWARLYRWFLILQMPWKKRSNEQRRRRIQMSSSQKSGEQLETLSPFLSLKLFVKWRQMLVLKTLCTSTPLFYLTWRLREKWKPSRPNTLWKNCVVLEFNQICWSSVQKNQLVKELRTSWLNSVMWHQKLSSSHLMWNICTKSHWTCKHKIWTKSFVTIWNWMFLQQIWQNGLRWSTRSWTSRSRSRFPWLENT